MYKTTILLIALVALTQANITFDTSKHCDCTELVQADCTSASKYCKWSTTCTEVTWSCANLAQTDCTAQGSSYQCGWANNACSDKTYTCADFTTADTCPGSKTLNCYWNTGSKCEAFSSCDKYDATHCPSNQKCQYSGTACAAVTYVTCSTFTSEATCQGQDSETSWCAWATAGTCKSLSGSACTDLNDFQKTCENYGCKFASNVCSYPACADKKTEESCKTITTGATERTLCTWASSACANAADATSLTAANCFSTSSRNYKWSADNKCVACSSLISNDSSSFSALPVFLVATLLIFA